MFVSVFAVLALTARADGLNCYAECVVLQTGPEAHQQIQSKVRPYKSTMRLVKDMGRVFGETMQSLRAQCTDLAHDVDWWKPPGDDVSAALVKSIEVDTSDAVAAVIAYEDLTQCERYSDRAGDGGRFGTQPPAEAD